MGKLGKPNGQAMAKFETNVYRVRGDQNGLEFSFSFWYHIATSDEEKGLFRPS
jgi:hypothetical protein